MAPNPTVSVILPTYNRSEWLRHSLPSVLRQSFHDFELLVIDDGSTDQTSEVLASHLCENPQPPIQILKTPHLGVSAARNLGISQSRGEFIALLDSDDQWQPHKLTKQVEALRQDSAAALCHTNEVWFRKGRRVNPCKHHEKKGGWIFEHCLPRCVISPSASLLRRSILDELGGFDESLPVCEDYDLWLRITARYPVAYLSEALTIKNGGHADQLSQAYPAMDRFRIQALEKILYSDVLSTTQCVQVQQTIADKSRIIYEGAQKRGNQEIVLRYFEKWQKALAALGQFSSTSKPEKIQQTA